MRKNYLLFVLEVHRCIEIRNIFDGALDDEILLTGV